MRLKDYYEYMVTRGKISYMQDEHEKINPRDSQFTNNYIKYI